MAAPQPGGSDTKAYMWDADEEFTVNVAPIEDFKRVEYETLHSYGHGGLFKPDMHEVASQLPEMETEGYVMTYPLGGFQGDRHKGLTTVFYHIKFR